jgi:hypothetical protein
LSAGEDRSDRPQTRETQFDICTEKLMQIISWYGAVVGAFRESTRRKTEAKAKEIEGKYGDIVKRFLGFNEDTDKGDFRYLQLCNILKPTSMTPHDQFQPLFAFFVLNLLGFIKGFDSTRKEHESENYYMEREWRVLTDFEFKLSNVERVILPRNYAKRFRRDFSEYYGQIHYPDLDETES